MGDALQNDTIVMGKAGETKERRSMATGKLDGSARFTAVNSLEARASAISGGLTVGDFAVGLCVGHAFVDALHNLLFAEAGILEARDFHGTQRTATLQATVKDKLDETVGDADEAKSDGVAANGIEPVGPGDFEDLRLQIAGVGEISGCIAAGKWMAVFVRRRNQGDASVIAQLGLLGFDQLGDLGIGGVQSFELLETAGPHASLVQRPIVRQRMRMATTREEDTSTEKHNSRLHTL
jgi:hypothetical protein